MGRNKTLPISKGLRLNTNCTTQFFRPSDGSLRDRDTMVLDSGQSNFVAILVATTIHTNIYLEFKVFEVSGLLSCPSDPANKSKNVNLKFHEFFDQWEQVLWVFFFHDFVIKNNLIDWNMYSWKFRIRNFKSGIRSKIFDPKSKMDFNFLYVSRQILTFASLVCYD